MNVHFINVGKSSIDPIITGLKHYSDIDLVCLIDSEGTKSVADKAQELIEAAICDEVSKIKIDPFVMNDLIIKVKRFADRLLEDKSIINFYYNMTMGTNIMAAASSIAIVLINATGYYVLDSRVLKEVKDKDLVKELPMFKIPNATDLTSVQWNILKILNSFGGNVDKSTYFRRNYCKDFKNKWGEQPDRVHKPQKVSASLKSLEKRGLIETKREGRNTCVKLKPAGKLLIELNITN